MRRTLARGALAVAIALGLAARPGVARGGGDGVAFEPEGSALSAALEKAAAPDGLVLVDLWTHGCTWCKTLDRETFSAPAVAAALDRVVCVRYDADVAPGRALADRFNVRSYPTVLFLDRAGEEVDRVVGFLPPERFVPEVARIRAGDGTLRAKRLAHEKDPTCAGLTVDYARKLAKAGDAAKAAALLRPIVDATPADPVARPRALLGLAEAALEAYDETAAVAWATRVVEEHPDADVVPRAWLLRVRVHARRGDIETALAEIARARPAVQDDADVVELESTAFWLLRTRTEKSLVRWGERADALSDTEGLLGAARAAFQSGLAVGSALRWAERAATLSARDPEALEVWADLLHRTGSVEKALCLVTEALGKALDADAKERLKARVARWTPAPATPPAPPKAPAAPGPDGPPR